MHEGKMSQNEPDEAFMECDWQTAPVVPLYALSTSPSSMTRIIPGECREVAASHVDPICPPAQVRTRGGRVASRAVVTFDDTHPVGSSSGGSSPAPSLDASEDYAPQDDVKVR
jgi:hypothetical protein